MKKAITGIIALLIPILIFAQNAKEAQDLTQLQKKVSRLEKDYQAVKKHTGSLQLSVEKLKDAMAREERAFKTFDSLVKSTRDTVATYSSRIDAIGGKVDAARDVLLIRKVIFIVVVVLMFIILVIIFLRHGKRHEQESAEWLEKLKSQREERERRVEELHSLLSAQKEETAMRLKEAEAALAKMRSEVALSGEELKRLLQELSARTDQRMGETASKIAADLQGGLSSLEQKIADQWKQYADLSHKQAEQLATVKKEITDHLGHLDKEVQGMKKKHD